MIYKDLGFASFTGTSEVNHFNLAQFAVGGVAANESGPITAAPSNGSNYGLILVCANRGTSDAFLVDDDETVESGKLIPAGGGATFGPFAWQSFASLVYAPDGVKVLVDVERVIA